MILREWRAPVREANIQPFATFMRQTLYPALQDEDAFEQMTTAVDRTGHLPQVLAVSLWDSMEGLRAFTGPEVEGVIFDAAEQYLAGDPTVAHHEVLDHRSK